MGAELSSACAWCWRASAGRNLGGGVAEGRPGPQTLVINRWDIEGDRRRLVQKREIEL